MDQILTPTVINVTLTSANTEYPAALPAGCRHFSVQCRSASDVRVAFVSGKVAGSTAPFATIKADSALSSPEKLSLPSGVGTLYLASADAGVVVEVIAWSAA